MADETYESILTKSWDDIPEPELLPVGSYLLRCRNATYRPAKGDMSAQVLFVYNPKEAMDDVDQDELTDLGEYDITQNRLFATFWVEDNVDWAKVRTHIQKHGVDPAGQSIGESLKAMTATEIISYVRTENYENKQGETVTKNTPTQFVSVDD